MQDVVKRNNSADSNKRKRKYSPYLIQFLFLSIIIFVIICVTILFNITNVVIMGNSIYSAEEILAASGLQSGNNLIRTNMTKTAEHIESQLVYIEKAEVKRSFPSTVKIIITPCVETANMEHSDGYFVISRSGKILLDLDEPYPDILTFYGAESKSDLKIGMLFESEDSKKTANIYELTEKTISGTMSDKIISFNISDRLNVSCDYQNRITIILGAVAEIDYKFKFAEVILSDKIGPETEGTLKILSNSATFIDKNGLENNENVYLNNIGLVSDDNDTQTEETTAETTQTVINFE